MHFISLFKNLKNNQLPSFGLVHTNAFWKKDILIVEIYTKQTILL